MDNYKGRISEFSSNKLNVHNQFYYYKNLSICGTLILHCGIKCTAFKITIYIISKKLQILLTKKNIYYIFKSYV